MRISKASLDFTLSGVLKLWNCLSAFILLVQSPFYRYCGEHYDFIFSYPSFYLFLHLVISILDALDTCKDWRNSIHSRKTVGELRWRSISGSLHSRESTKRMPYNKYKEYYPKSTDLRIYYKTSDGRQPKASEMQVRGMLEGWDLHVIYLDGVSVMEIYRRSKTITEFNLSTYLISSWWVLLEKGCRHGTFGRR